MTDCPGISVIIPFRNSEVNIAACIESLLDQRDVGCSYEIILVDNLSEDASPSIAARFDGISVLKEAVPGAYPARNAALRVARAPLLAFTDADCVAHEDWLRVIREGMQVDSRAILIGQCRYPTNASRALHWVGAYENAKAEYVAGNCPPAYHFAYANNMAVRASLFEEIGLFKEWKRAGDTELVHRMAEHRPDLQIAYLDAMQVTHREFLSGRTRLDRLRLYTRKNSRIQSFRELGLGQRLGVFGNTLRRLRRG